MRRAAPSEDGYHRASTAYRSSRDKALIRVVALEGVVAVAAMLGDAHCAVVNVDLGRHRDDAMQWGFAERQVGVKVALAYGRLHRGGRRE